MGRADYFALGDWNAICDQCGRKRKGSTLRLQWNGLWVCPEHWEPRQPQDFVKAVPEHPTPPFVRTPTDNFMPVICTINGSASIVDFAVVDCVTIDYIPASFDPSVI